MDKFKFLQGRLNRLPPGFRFQPTDEEIVFQYLRCKVFSHPMPASIIPELDPCNLDPWDLTGNSDQEKYFFSKRSTRVTNSGYWKAIGAAKEIKSSSTKGLVGMKRRLVFYMGKSPRGCKTEWIMHEYCLATAASTSQNLAEMEKWVLCHIFTKARSTNVEPNNEVLYSRFNSCMAQEGGNSSPVLSSTSSHSSNHTFIEPDNEDSGCSYGVSFSFGGRP